MNSILREELVRLGKDRPWELPGAWQPSHNAIACMRTTLRLLAESKMSAADALAETPAARTLRGKMVDACQPVYDAGAAINFRRGALVTEKIAPEMAEKAERKADSVEALV